MPQDTSAESSFFYLLDKCIRAYRQFAQKQLGAQGLDISIDQWLVLSAIANNPHATQQEIAEFVFKDAASLTRIIDLLVKKGLLDRVSSADDRRRFKLTFTPAGEDLLDQSSAIAIKNREDALKNIPGEDLETAARVFGRILSNILENNQSTK